MTPLRAAVTRLAAAAILAATTWIPVATQSRLRPAIVFVSTRDNPAGTLADASEIYLMDVDGTNARRLTDNHDGDSLPAISPDGTRVVFDSNRLRTAGQPANTTHLFLMNIDGSAQAPLTWGARHPGRRTERGLPSMRRHQARRPRREWSRVHRHPTATSSSPTSKVCSSTVIAAEGTAEVNTGIVRAPA